MQDNTNVTNAAEQEGTQQPVQVKKNIFGKPKKEKPKKTMKQEVIEWILTIATALVLAFFIRTFLGELVVVDGNSMYATLHNGEVMVVDKTQYATSVLPFGRYALGGEPQRFDVVICHYPDRGNTNFVKRVVGLPGDQLAIEVEMDAKGNPIGVLYVNGVRYEEPYLVNHINYYLVDYWDTRSVRYTLENPYTVPEGKYFVLGDNRSNSNDSHLVGPIDRTMIMGRVFYVIKPAGGESRRSIPNGLEDTHTRVLENGL